MPRPETGFVHLHTHTEYSLLDGLGQVAEIPVAAAAAGQTAVAITDHGTLGGTWKFAHACRDAGIKAILGMEAYLAIGGDRHDPQVVYVPRGADVDGGDEGASDTKRKANEHLTLLAATKQGWTNLTRIANAAQQSFYGKPLADLKLLKKHGEGLIVLTGCLGGPVAGPAARGEMAAAEKNLCALIEAVGVDNVYVEIMDHGIELEKAALQPLGTLADKYGVQMVVTNDAHYIHECDASTHDIWLASQSNAQLSSSKRFKFNGDGYHLRTEEEMRAVRPRSRRWQEACTTTVALAERIDEWVLPESRIRMPHFPLPDGFDSPDTYVHHLVREGAKLRYGAPLPEQVKTRLRHEFDLISSMGFAGYFLIVWELVAWARSQGILVGPGRGSSAGSATAYCLKITDIDPLPANLLFERFLEPGRSDMPDIDVDFEKGRIPEVHQHLRDLYGHDCVARLGTYQMARTKHAIKTVARVLAQSGLGTRMASLVPVEQGKPASCTRLVDPEYEGAADFRALIDTDGEADVIFDHARSAEDAVVGASIHACGVIISDEPLPELIPLRKDRLGAAKNLPADEQGWVTEWDGKDSEAFGLLKLDALYLRSLDILAATADQIAKTTDEAIDFAHAPDSADTDHPRVRAAFDLLRSGRTSAIFQMEGAGMSELLVGVGPTTLADLSVISALYRPGPMSARMGDHFVARRHGKEAVDYGMYTDDPAEQQALAEVLSETEGLIVYQEQAMRLGTVVAGFDAAERALMRRAIGKKKKELMDRAGEMFLSRAGEVFTDDQGIVVSPRFARATAERLWGMLKGSAEYSFNASHGYAYGRVSFLTAYAKANWPTEYAAGVLSCTVDDDKRRAVMSTLAQDGIQVAPPDINLGERRTSVGEDGRLRLGLAEVRDVGKAAEHVIAERDAGGRYTSVVDAVQRLGPAGVNARAMEALVEAGAFDNFGPRLGNVMALRAGADLAIDADWGPMERSERQRARLGVRIGDHPLAAHREALREWRSTDAVHADSGQPLGRCAIGVGKLQRTDLGDRGRTVLTAGVLVHWDQKATKSGQRAVFVLEGTDGSQVEGVMWNSDLNRQLKVGLPPVGSAVAVHGWAKRRTIEVRAVDLDGADIDTTDDDQSEATRTVEVLQLRADLVEHIALSDPPHEVLPAAPVIDLAAAARRGRLLRAAKGNRNSRRSTASPPSRSPSTPEGQKPTAGHEPQSVPQAAQQSGALLLITNPRRMGHYEALDQDGHVLGSAVAGKLRSGLPPQAVSHARQHPGRIVSCGSADTMIFVAAVALEAMGVKDRTALVAACRKVNYQELGQMGVSTVAWDSPETAEAA